MAADVFVCHVLLQLSWTTIVVHSRDDQEVGMAHEVKSPDNQPQFSHTMMGKVKLSPNKLLDQPEILSKSCHWILKKISTDWLTACLPACLPDAFRLAQYNSLGYRLDFFTVRRHFSPRGAFWHIAVPAMHSSRTYQWPPLCSIHLCWQWKALIWRLHMMASFA